MNLTTDLQPLHPENAPLTEINITPLIDVMLVLLIMLIITIAPPLHSVLLEFPHATTSSDATTPIVMQLEITENDDVILNGLTLQDDHALDHALIDIAKNDPQPTLHILAHPGTSYGALIRILALAKQHDITKLGMVESDAITQF